jgi:tRNA (guanine-N7-)-methyltransferase
MAEAPALGTAVRARAHDCDAGARLWPGGIFRFATDIRTMPPGRWALDPRAGFLFGAAERADDWGERWAGFHATRYEAKAKREGRTPCYLEFRRKA